MAAVRIMEGARSQRDLTARQHQLQRQREQEKDQIEKYK